MADEDIDRLEIIAQRSCTIDGQSQPVLTEDELYNLSIRKGTLTTEERQVINNHATVSIQMLSQLPFSKTLRRVPEIAGGHHEKLDGNGYPRGLTADRLSLQVRILAVADIFEALTAPDRPYRKPMQLSKALGIIEKMVGGNELDKQIVDLFVESGTAMKYAEKELEPSQLEG